MLRCLRPVDLEIMPPSPSTFKPVLSVKGQRQSIFVANFKNICAASHFHSDSILLLHWDCYFP